MRRSFVGNYLRNLSPISDCCRCTRNAKRYPTKSVIVVTTFPCMVRPCMVCPIQLIFPQLTFLTLVLFNGYEVFTRHNPLWGFVNTSWGFYVSSWVELGILIVALLGWLVHGYISSGKWGLRVPDPQNAEIVDGRAEDLDDIIPSQRNRFTRTVLWILNNI